MPVKPRKRGSNAVTYCLSTSGVSRSGSTVISSTCTRSASGPSFFITSVSSASEVGQTSGHCVKPKNTTTALPAKSCNVRVLPL